jgi:hypothetical protein
MAKKRKSRVAIPDDELKQFLTKHEAKKKELGELARLFIAEHYLGMKEKPKWRSVYNKMHTVLASMNVAADKKKRYVSVNGGDWEGNPFDSPLDTSGNANNPYVDSTPEKKPEKKPAKVQPSKAEAIRYLRAHLRALKEEQAAVEAALDHLVD